MSTAITTKKRTARDLDQVPVDDYIDKVRDREFDQITELVSELDSGIDGAWENLNLPPPQNIKLHEELARDARDMHRGDHGPMVLPTPTLEENVRTMAVYANRARKLLLLLDTYHQKSIKRRRADRAAEAELMQEIDNLDL